MSSLAKKELILEGLDCANCATKIEEQVQKVEGVSGASLNFVTKILTINMESNGKQEDVLNQANQIINKLEPDVIIKDKALARKEKKVLLLIGLDCANCATKIEKEVNSLDGVSSATVDFVSRKLTIEVDQKRDLPRVVEQASKIAVQIESGIKVVENEDTKEESKEDGGIKKSK
uniref:cation transporter n=1 Tax=Desulfosporosinus sp. TaxID=157907 RepID=UPI0026077320